MGTVDSEDTTAVVDSWGQEEEQAAKVEHPPMKCGPGRSCEQLGLAAMGEDNEAFKTLRSWQAMAN